jgi:biopolymer transport protein ExbB/TolQ
MSDAGWGIVFVLGLSLMITVIFCLIFWQAMKTGRVKDRHRYMAERTEEYRSLATRVTEAQETAARELTTLREDVNDLRTRVTAIERMLREVE